jgi:hypothetical protein
MKLLRNGLLLLLLTATLYLGAIAALTFVRIGGIPLIYRTALYYVWKGGNTWQRYQEYDPGVPHDVIVLGSSHAYRGYDPVLFAQRGYDLFNLGTSAQTMVQTRILAEEYLDHGNTGLLIVEISKASLGNDGVESAADLTQNVSSDRAAWRIGRAVGDPRGWNMLALRLMMKARPPMYLDSTYVGRGYCSSTDVFDGHLPYEGSGVYRVAKEQAAALHALIAYCNDRHIPLVLVNHPMPLAWDREHHASYVRAVNELVLGTGTHFIDMGLGHDLDNTHFADHSHLNQRGVERFVPALIDSLEALGLLRPHAVQ